MWAYESVFYQIYPLGFCGAPKSNDGVTVNRIGKVTEWLDHIKASGADAIYMSPIFESDNHGYDTRDYRKIDCRLGTNEDFADVCRELHKRGMKIVLDGVFNHVGRGFWAFR
ncbi:MAG: maltodextrin glucosidase, partial [Oscillospiraceae bacterium]|nr:maltodextrin glucosidase [Oscillospiraceae bacterium]